MSAQIPVEVRRNYSVKTEKDHWVLKCDCCPTSFRLEKPKKGEKIHGGNVLELLNHALTHPIAEEAEEEVNTAVTPDPVPQVEVAPTKPKLSIVPPLPPPSNQLIVHASIKHTLPTPKAPNCYRVDQVGSAISVSHFRDPTYNQHRQVFKTDTGYSVVLYAANQKHAEMVASRLIEDHKKTQS